MILFEKSLLYLHIMGKTSEIEFDTIVRNINIHILTGIELTYPYNRIYETLNKLNCLNIYVENNDYNSARLFYGHNKKDIKFQTFMGWIRFETYLVNYLNQYLVNIPPQELLMWFIINCSDVKLPILHSGEGEHVGSYATLDLNHLSHKLEPIKNEMDI